jgi:thiamine biosynthesis lipoprotein
LLFAATDGAVDPLVGSTLELLGYDALYTLTPVPPAVRAHHVRHRPTWSADIEREGSRLITRRPVVLDVGAIGKGYLVDIVSTIVLDAGMSDFVVDAGGDLRCYGDREIHVGLEHPRDPALVIGTAGLRDSALCASAGNRRAWGDDLHHLIDARSGIPASDVIASWVIADDAALADGLATALFFAGADRLGARFRFEYVVVRADGRAERSSGFAGELFIPSR